MKRALLIIITLTNWKEITGNDLPINIYGRQSNSGTHSFVQKKLKIKFSPKGKEMNGNAQIMEGIKVDPSGIGYVGAGYLLNTDEKNMKVKALKIKDTKDGTAISPLDHEAIKAKKYFFKGHFISLYVQSPGRKQNPSLVLKKRKQVKT